MMMPEKITTLEQLLKAQENRGGSRRDDVLHGIQQAQALVGCTLVAVREYDHVMEDIKELVFTGRVVEADEAIALGLATRICEDPVAEALALARTIAAQSPHAIRASKTLLNRCVDLTVAEALAFETELQLPLLGSPNQLEAVQATFQKRAPVFTDPELP